MRAVFNDAMTLLSIIIIIMCVCVCVCVCVCMCVCVCVGAVMYAQVSVEHPIHFISIIQSIRSGNMPHLICAK